MGKMQRDKGKAFERRIANVFRDRWPAVTFRRSSQAERAYQSDVFAEGNALLERMWFELQDARNPTPLKKLKQAEFDISVLSASVERLPVVVWHKIHERTEHVTTRLWVVDTIRGRLPGIADAVVTMPLDEFVALVTEVV